MRVGIMQPYFFPYIGYYDLINRTDSWVVFDVVQYTPKSWMNRNRILHPQKDWQYIGIPVNKTPRGTLITNIQIADKYQALDRILGQINHYKKKAPYFKQVSNLIIDTFELSKTDRLLDLNISSLRVISDYLGIEFNWSICSRMKLNLQNIDHPGKWALEITKQLNANEYINPPGGRDIFKENEWNEAFIKLTFTDLPKFTYDCSPYQFIENLSILDVLMWNTPVSVKQYLDRGINIV